MAQRVIREGMVLAQCQYEARLDRSHPIAGDDDQFANPIIAGLLKPPRV